jgi:spermidine synthase
MCDSVSQLTRGHFASFLVLFFISGFAALVYQVLWVRELGLLFGSTAQAAALAIAIFFAGIALGGWFWGRQAARVRSSLLWFGILEVGVAITALGHFVLVDAYHAIYPSIYAAAGHHPTLDTLSKSAIAATILLPPAFLMGGTLPLMGQHLISRRGGLSTTGTILYAVNTAGSATGALAAAFVLPVLLGFRDSYLLAIALDAFVGISAILLAFRFLQSGGERITVSRMERPAPVEAPSTAHCEGFSRPVIWTVAFASGFATLGVEVLWTRLFSQVLQNSAYTYALVLTAFLVALAIGALVANLLARIRGVAPEIVLLALLGASGIAVAASPWIFTDATDGLRYVGSDLGWHAYLGAVASVAVVAILIPGIVFGAVLPYLLRVAEGAKAAPGQVLGSLVAANTAGAILGSLAAGFVMLPVLGAWRSLLVLAAVYPLLAAFVLLQSVSMPRLAFAGAGAGIALIIAGLGTAGLDTMRLGTGERLIELRQGSHANVAVVGRGDDRLIRVNNYYTLGGSRGWNSERNQAAIPLMLHPGAHSVFFLGMGTGITSGASLSFPVERVVVCELLPEVVDLAERHFRPWTNGLFEDPRVEIHAEDGRNCLRRSSERFDLIISDLFTPWKAGTGNLYTREHFETARKRLNSGGMFVQWIPLYQVSEREFGIIARTMGEAFEQVTLWRGDLFSNRSIVALVGHTDDAPLNPSVIGANARALGKQVGVADGIAESVALRLYAGNARESGLFDGYAVNTDDNALIEYLAPRTHRDVRVGKANFLVGYAREDLYTSLLAAIDPAVDPYLAHLTAEQRGYVIAGWHRSRYAMFADRGTTDVADMHYNEFIRHSAPASTHSLTPAVAFLPDAWTSAVP